MSRQPTDAKSIFHQVLKLEPNARAAFLDEACGDNDRLRQRVKALLRAHDDAGSFLDKPALQFQATQPAPSGDDRDRAADQPLDFLKPCDKPDRIGQLGNYEIVELIGSGGMGIVLRGVDPKLNRVVAIKVLAPELASKPEACKRFLREGQAAAAINHDHVVTIYGIDDSGPLPLIVMEYVSGQSLQQRIDEKGSLELKEILRIGKQTALGLAAAHAEGLIHRDIKPANILLENGVERVKITDFGLARAVDDVSITRSGTVAGTPQYMSPEQARGDSVDHRSDLFSLGGVLYAMCSGGPPFRADSTLAMIRQVCEEQPKPIQKVNPELPSWLAEIIDRLLEKDRDARLQSAPEVADLLGRHLLHLQQPGVNPQPPRVGRATRRSSGLGGGWQNRPTWFAAVAAVLLLVAGISVAEISGATHFRRTVIRVLYGEGTLVIEVDDPDVEVEVVGQELVIKGAGVQQFRVSPGQHTVVTRKDGNKIRSEIVSIVRNGKQIVRVRLEETPPVLSTAIVWEDVVDWGFTGQVSPDGRYVSYVDWVQLDLGVRDLDTETNRLLTDTMGRQYVYHSIFSPDSQQIAYQFFPGSRGQFGEVWTVGVDGTEPRRIFAREEVGAVPAAWSPDGKQILAILGVGEDPKGHLALISASDGSVREVKTMNDAQRPISFSPNGEYVAYSHAQPGSETHRDISLLATDGSQEKIAIEHPADDYVLGWTPDGKELVFASVRPDILYAYTIPIVDGLAQGESKMATQLGPIRPMGFTDHGSFFYGRHLQHQNIHTAAVDVETGDVQMQRTPAIPYQASAPDWSPDGRSLACRLRTKTFLIHSVETGESEELVPKGGRSKNYHSLRWSPDGDSFLYANISNVHKMDVETQEVTVLLPKEPPPEGPRVLDADWSHDGKAIFYVEDTPDPDDPHRVVQRQLDSGQEALLCHISEHVLWLTASPVGQRLALLTWIGGDERTVKIVPATGGEPHELLRDKQITALAWTTDGSYLLYGLGNENTELWRVNVENGMPNKLDLKVIGQMRHLQVHPEGNQIAFNVSTGRSELVVMKNFFVSLDRDR